MPQDDPLASLASSASSPPQAADLARLRAELDAIDDALLADLTRRAAVVAEVAALKNGGFAWRPGREAAILRRLLARTESPLARGVVVRVWREVLSGSLLQQGPLGIAVCDPDRSFRLPRLARDHFGGLVQERVHESPAQVLADIRSGLARIGVLPPPAEEVAEREAWWTHLAAEQGRFAIAARLPFWRPAGEGGGAEAFAVAPLDPDPSGDDLSLFLLRFAPETSRARLADALGRAGFTLSRLVIRRPSGAPAEALVGLEGYLSADDPRFTALAAALPLTDPPARLGAYARPIEEEAP
jgi:chorismate mutase/prephenate dehydratase